MATPRDDFAESEPQAKPGEAGRSVPTSEGVGLSVLTSLRSRRAEMLFEAEAPGPVEIVVRVGAEGDHGLGAGDAGDLGDLFGDYFGEAFEIRDANHDDEVVGARNRVGLGYAFYGEHGLGGLLDALALGPDEYYGRYHAHPLYPKLHRSREGVVGSRFLVLYRGH